jgi:hypothetical protein
MRIVPIIIPRIDEINYTIVPPSRDGGKSVGTQIRDLRDVYNRGGDTITVEDDAVFEDTEYMNEDGGTSDTNRWLKIFDDLAGPNGGTSSYISVRPRRMVKEGVMMTDELFNKLIERFNNYPEIYQTISWVDRSQKVIKDAGVGKIMTDDEGNVVSQRPGVISKDEKTLLAFRNFVNNIRSKVTSIDPSGGLNKVINVYDSLVNNEGNAVQKAKGVGSTSKMTGILDITKDLEFQKNEINNYIKIEIEKLERGEEKNPLASEKIWQRIGVSHVTAQSVKKNASPIERDAIDLERKIKGEKNPLIKRDLERQLAILKAQEVEAPENYEGNDLADANLLLTYAVLTGDVEMVTKVFEVLKGSDKVNFNQQERIGGRFQKKLLNRLLAVAEKNKDEDIVYQLNAYASLAESFIPKKLIMTERQAKLLSMLKEDAISENLATNITKKELGYRCPTDHRKIKNLDKTDYAKKLKDERESRTNVAANVTKNAKTFGYKTPTNRKRSLAVHKNDDIKDNEIINSYFAKEKKSKKTESNTLTKKEIIESILKNIK